MDVGDISILVVVGELGSDENCRRTPGYSLGSDHTESQEYGRFIQLPTVINRLWSRLYL
jgi:hypothetical protein